MGRPRTPAKILELKGAFKHDPSRRRIDAEGAGCFNELPPPHLPRDVVPAWKYIVTRLPKVALSTSDDIAVEAAARLLAVWWVSNDLDTLKELRQWLGKLGMTPVDRTKIPGEAPKRDNRFEGL